MQNQKTLPQARQIDLIAFISVCLVTLFFMSIFINRDIKHFFAYTGIDISSFLVDLLPIPIGIVCSISLFLSLSKNVFQQRPIQMSIKTFTPIALAAIFIFGIVFNGRILIARELIEFKLHEQAFDQLVGFGQKALKSTTGCGGVAELPSAIRDVLGHHTMDFGVDWQGTTWTMLFQDRGERESDFFYVDGKLPTLGSMTGACGALIECYSQINDHWFLCTEYSRDI